MNPKSRILPHKRISDVLFWSKTQLKNLENPKLESEVLLSEILKKDRVFLKTHSDETLSPKQRLKYAHWTYKRAKHIPLAYIRGYQDWNGLQIQVNKHTLIPRDETEILAQKIVEQNNSSAARVLDIGTGSGCLAIFLKKSFPLADITGIDISKKALSKAKRNALELNTDIQFLYSNLLKKIIPKSHFDIIVANLPYVPESITVSEEVQKEPHSAIFAEDDGLALIKRLRKELEQKEITFGQLWLEFLPQQKKEIQETFKPWKSTFETDMGGDIFFVKITE